MGKKVLKLKYTGSPSFKLQARRKCLDFYISSTAAHIASAPSSLFGQVSYYGNLGILHCIVSATIQRDHHSLHFSGLYLGVNIWKRLQNT